MIAHQELKREATVVYAKAVRDGVLTRGEFCEKCGINPEKTIHGHHTDYSKPLEVQWLCGACHGAEHMFIGPREAVYPVLFRVGPDLLSRLDAYRERAYLATGEMPSRTHVVRDALVEYLKKSEVTQ